MSQNSAANDRKPAERKTISVLTGEDRRKLETRLLYETCFDEDTERFVDYYYQEKCRDNEILVMEEAGNIVSMVHANPFTVSLFGKKRTVSYIVAVATDPAYRRQGRMRLLMGETLLRAYGRKEPFSFLMPADPAYYEPLGYRFWTNQWIHSISEREEQNILRDWEAMDIGKSGDAVRIDRGNQWLAEHYDCFIYRDAAYYRRLIAEQESEEGAVLIHPGHTFGVACYSCEEGPEIREPFGELSVTPERKPFLMGRIVHLEQFVALLRSEKPFTAEYYIKDEIIPDNNGHFRIETDSKGGQLIRFPVGAADVESIDIAVLGQLLFDHVRIFINELV